MMMSSFRIIWRIWYCTMMDDLCVSVVQHRRRRSRCLEWKLTAIYMQLNEDEVPKEEKKPGSDDEKPLSKSGKEMDSILRKLQKDGEDDESEESAEEMSDDVRTVSDLGTDLDCVFCRTRRRQRAMRAA